MTNFAVGTGFAFVLSFAFVLLYALLSAFAQALESLSSIRRKSLLEGQEGKFGKLLAIENVSISRVAVRLTAQGAVLAGLLSLGTGLAGLAVPEPYLVSAVSILLGWIVIETVVIRSVARRGAEDLLVDFSWLIPVVLLFATPLYPLLSRLVTPLDDDEDAEPVSAAEKEAEKDADVRALLDMAREEGILEKHEEELVSRAVDFGDRTVREVMTSRPDMVVAEADLPFEKVADLFEKTKYTRIPLVEGGVEKPIGVVHVKDVFSSLRTAVPPVNARSLARPVLFAPETQTITTLLSDFRRRRQHMAIVVDEWGAVAGVVTLEDLLEELVGEIADEHEDSIDPVIPLAEGAFTVAGRVRVSEIAQLFDADLPPGDYDTVAGLLSARLGHIPRPGEEVEDGGLRFVVEDADRKRVHRVKVMRPRELA
ncbi:MAG: HlyC/CorC family transporter [Holophagales bacterium]|nr:HlyC/CorC family transporter [Holophagales bacterium]